jgi:flavodoxin
MSGALVICVSVSQGNTLRLAHAIAKELHGQVRAPEEVDPRRLGGHDVVGFGSGIYYMSHHARLRRFVTALPRVDGTPAFVYATAGTGRLQKRPWERSLEELLRDKGYDVLGSFACRGLDTYGPYGLVGGLNKQHPDGQDLARARAFADDIAERATQRATQRPTPRRPRARRGAAS